MSNNNKPEASVFVSYYNGLKFLPIFLENYKTQTAFPLMEMIVVACCLSEEERKLFTNFQEAHPGKLILKEYKDLKPQSVCWNDGIALATSDIVGAWGVDDVRTDDSFERIINVFKTQPEVGVVAGNFAVSRKYPERRGEYIEHRYFSLNDWQRGMLLGPFWMFRKNLCEKAGYFDEQLKVGADYDLSVRLLANTKVGVTNYLLGYFLDEGKGLSTRGDNVQPVERTVVELRYGFTDKLVNEFIAPAEKYDIQHLHQPNNTKKNPSEFIPNFEDFVNKKGLIHDE